jgi:hypothetical protein
MLILECDRSAGATGQKRLQVGQQSGDTKQWWHLPARTDSKPVGVQSRQGFRGRCGIDEAIATTTMSFASSTSLGRVETTRNHRAKASIGVIYRRAQ